VLVLSLLLGTPCLSLIGAVGAALLEPGLYVDLAAWCYNVQAGSARHMTGSGKAEARRGARHRNRRPSGAAASLVKTRGWRP
jgi:hypothetical protein